MARIRSEVPTSQLEEPRIQANGLLSLGLAKLVLFAFTLVILLMTLLLFGQGSAPAIEPVRFESGAAPGGSFAPAAADPTDSDDPADSDSAATNDRARSACVGTRVRSGADLDAIVNADSDTKPTTFCIQAGTYYVNETINVRSGDRLFGTPGTVTRRGPAVDPKPRVKIVNAGGLARIFDVAGNNIRLEWLEVRGSASGARYTNDTVGTCINWGEASGRCPANGTGIGIAAARSGAGTVFSHLEVHHNPANCVTGLSGRLINSQLYRCSQNADYWGFSAAALKTTNEAEMARNFVHNNEAVGLWCDSSCSNVSSRSKGFWVHHNLVVRNGRTGVRYENSPMAGSGDRPSQITALVERNRLAGNDWGGADMHDAQNATYRYNIFGPQTVSGVKYGRNGSGKKALEFSDSGRADRTNLRNGAAIGNVMNGETINNCDQPDTIVDCRGNRR